jgi:hypothetical protein
LLVTCFMLISCFAYSLRWRRHVLPKCCWLSVDYEVLHPRRQNSSWPALWEPQSPKLIVIKMSKIKIVFLFSFIDPNRQVVRWSAKGEHFTVS